VKTTTQASSTKGRKRKKGKTKTSHLKDGMRESGIREPEE
jgi:hypothetical protein